MNRLSEKCSLNASTHTLPAQCNSKSSSSSSSSSSSLGVQRFCSRLRHKIEDNLTKARQTHKFVKGSRHSMSMSSLSGLTDATIGKYTNYTKTGNNNNNNNNDGVVKDGKLKKVSGMLKYRRNKSTQHLVQQQDEEKSLSPTSPTKKISFVGTYVDSDEEYQLPSLNKQSLEDEIFEELEKVAHDEKKLNSVLQTFDRILTDFHDEFDVKNLLAASKSILQSNENEHETTEKNDKVIYENVEMTTSATINVAPVNVEQMSSINLSENDDEKLTDKIEQIDKSIIDNTTSTTTLTTTIVATSKIPLWKALPLNKRSKSFCYTTLEETLHKLNASNKTNDINGNYHNPSTKSMLRNRAVSYTALPRQQQHQQQSTLHQRSPIKIKPPKLIKCKTELNVKTPKQPTKMKTNIPPPITTIGRRSHTNSDELLDKCLEKGQQILRQIESLGTTSTPIKKTKITNATTKKKVIVSCNKKSTTTTTPTITPASTCEINYMADKGRQNSDALSDDSGHISNEANDTANTSSQQPCEMTCNKSSSSSKVFKLKQKFETPKSAKIVESTKLAKLSLLVHEIEPVHCIETHVQIYPTYSKEVTTWYY